MTSEIVTESLTEEQWKIVRELADFLAEEQIRLDKKSAQAKKSDGIATELKKTVTYLYELYYNKNKEKNYTNVGAKFFKYLEILVQYGSQIGHSGNTPDYYRSIDKACRQYLQSEQANPHAMLQILGWAARLVRYYRYDKELNKNSESFTPTPQLASTSKAQERKTETTCKYKEGQILDAKIVDRIDKFIDSKKTKTIIVYEVDGEKLDKSEEIYNIEKKGISLKVGDVVKLKLIEVNNERIKKIERIEA